MKEQKTIRKYKGLFYKHNPDDLDAKVFRQLAYNGSRLAQLRNEIGLIVC